MFGMDNEKKTLLVQEVYRRPLIWKVSLNKKANNFGNS